MEKQKNTARFVKVFFSVIFLILMSLSFAYGVYRGSDYLVKERSKVYQKYRGYLQKEEEIEETVIQAAKNLLYEVEIVIDENRLTAEAKKNEYGIKETAVQISRVELNSQTEIQTETATAASFSRDDYELDNLAYLEGIHGAVVLGDYYYEKEGITGSLHKYIWDNEFDYDTFLDDKIAAFQYDGDRAYIRYSDGSIKEYRDIDDLNEIDKAISELGKNIDSSKVKLYIWADEEYYADKNIWLENIETLQDYNLRDIMISFGIAGVSFLMASLLSVRTKGGNMRRGQVYTEIPLVLLGFGLLGGYGIFDSFWEIHDVYNRNKKILVTFISTLLLFGIYLCVRECVIKCRERRFWKDFCIIKLGKGIGKRCKNVFRLILNKSNYKDFSITKKLWLRRILFMIFSIIYILVITVLINRLGVSYGYTGWGYYEYVEPAPVIFAGIIYIIFFLLYNYYEMKFLKSLNDVYNQINDIYRGEYVVRKVDEGDMTYDITQKLNGLSNGLGEAIEKRISSEKMKVELITNVSHDLKTPLTSIISYVNLLKEEEMTDVAAAYVKILEDKSYQLRDIVSDVFDLAKANSGQDVEIETIDGIMLINQVLADMSDTIERSGKTVRTDIRPDTFFIRGDGRKLYRALQNLIDNALKYSMEGTRIYIHSGVAEDKLKLVIKNIAAYEMSFSGEDIVERFVRGDEARTTEGNGLGLSIAKSFIEVSGGRMKAEVDGDVFKVTVEF